MYDIMFMLSLIFAGDRDRGKKKPKVEKKEPESPTSKMPKIPLMDPQSVRANAKRALFQTLWKRCKHVFAAAWFLLAYLCTHIIGAKM